MSDAAPGASAPQASAPAAPGAPAARIIDRGYRRYSGDRTGVRGAVWTVWLSSVQRALGLRRSAWAKVMPFAAVLISYVPAVVFIGQVALLGDEDVVGLELPSYGDYFPYIQAALTLVVAFVGPEVLCGDRRTGMLGIYLASPLTRDSYLAAKAAAIASVLSLVTIGPTLLMLVAYVLQGVGPDGPGGVASTLARIVGSGLFLSVLYTAVSMGVSSLTDRKAFATASLLLLLVVSSFFLGVLVEVAGLPDAAHAGNLLLGSFSFVQLVHGEAPDLEGLTLPVTSLGLGAWAVAGAVVCRVRYQLLQVTR